MAEPSGDSAKASAAVHGATSGGVAGTHAGPEPLQLHAGPATEAQFNTIRSAIFPIACFKLDAIRFDFDSSVIRPEVRAEMPLLASLIAQHTSRPSASAPNGRVPPVSIFGHADPVGDDDYNKRLSGRRAAAVYGMLTRRPEVWEDLFSNGGKFASLAIGDKWEIRALQIMLNAVLQDEETSDETAPLGTNSAAAKSQDASLPLDQFPEGLDPTEKLESPDPPDPPPPGAKSDPLDVNGRLDDATQAAVKRFQSSERGRAAGLAIDGDPGPQTRHELFLAYMDHICIDRSGLPFQVDAKQGFLGGGSDASGKGDFHGCGEFNPVLVFSSQERAAFEDAPDKSARNVANASNRRVVVLLFRPGVKITNSKWPCPRAKEGVAACRARFWSDGERRREPTNVQREFADTQDTFACRFYQRLTTGSPCEKSISTDRVVRRIQIHDALYEPCRNEACIITGDGGFFDRGLTDDEGVLVIKVPRTLPRVIIRYTPKQRDVEYAVTATFVVPQAKDDQSLIAHLRNFGFGGNKDPNETTVLKFQAAHEDLALTGSLDDPTKQAIDELLAAELKPRLGGDRG